MSANTGTLPLLRAALRRDRVLLPVWLVALSSMVAASAVAINQLYASTPELIMASKVINTSPALVALYGPILNEDSLGELAMSKMTVMYAMFVMGMVLVIVRRHTRTEEETGRAELVGATVVGQRAPLRAAVLEGVIASVAVGLLAAVSNLAGGLEPAGSIAFGLSWLGIGLVGTGSAAVCCQVSASPRTCGGLAMAVIAFWFVLRAAGDIGPDLLGWLSPLGWGTRINAWGDTRWWVVGLYLGLAVVLIGAAHVMRERRDLGSGLLAERPGPRDGALGSTPALLWRLNRTSMFWWVVSTVLFGVLFGSIAPNIGGLFDSPMGRAALEALGGKGKVQETMLAALLAVMAALISAQALQVVSGAGHEETSGRTAVVLAADGSRATVFWSVVGLALLGAVLLTTTYAIGSAIGFGSQVDGIGPALVSLIPASWAHVPAMWVLTSFAVLAWSLRSTWAWLGWVMLGVFVTLGELGGLLKLPEWTMKLSPFQHVATVPVQAVDWSSEVGLVVVAAVVLGLAWLRFRVRDLG